MARCAIWGEEADQLPTSGDSEKYNSPRAGGIYVITGTALAMISDWSASEKARLTTWLVDQRRFGDPEPTIRSETLTQVRLKRPLRHSDRKERFFLALSARGYRPSHSLKLWGIETPATVKDRQKFSAWLESESDDETTAMVRLIEAEGFLSSNGNGRFALTPAGFAKLEEAETGGAPTDQAFVAMWFHPSMSDAYALGIKPAVEAAGYKPFRVDAAETNGKIDDLIVAELRKSRFVVADFTCAIFEEGGVQRSEPRGGVYYEAGFAQGLGAAVIWTVRSDCIGLVHFDTRQYAHIVWDTPTELREKLANRIVALLGQGPGRSS